jgi:hypothetical protein
MSFGSDQFLNLVAEGREVAAMQVSGALQGYPLLSCLEGGEWFEALRDRGEWLVVYSSVWTMQPR